MDFLTTKPDKAPFLDNQKCILKPDIQFKIPIALIKAIEIAAYIGI
jgi:hypothetical protein